MQNSINTSSCKNMEEIDNMIIEINKFLKKLNKIRERKIMSSSLAKSFESVLNSIEDILDNQPTLIESKSENNDKDLKSNEISITRKFFCEICSDYVHDDLCSHMNGSEHILSQLNFVKVQSQLLSTEIQKSMSAVDPLKQDVKLQIMYNHIMPLHYDEKINQKSFVNFLDSFLPIISSKYQLNIVQLFGSRLFCISKPFSEYDVFIDIKEAASVFSHQEPNLKLFIRTVSDIFDNEPKFKVCNWSGSTIAVKDIDQNLVFKLSFADGYMKVYQAALIKYLFQSSLHRKVCHLIIRISQMCKFELSSYNFVLLLLYYYQAKSILPPICYLQKDLPPINCGAWQVNFDPKPLYLDCEQNSLVDNYANCILNLINFFKFYANFDFTNNVICPHLGCAIPKTEFEETLLLIPSFLSFRKKDPTNQFKIRNRGGNIQDPLELNSYNAIRKNKVRRFKRFCRKVLATNTISLN